jgi:hypothetical protein
METMTSFREARKDEYDILKILAESKGVGAPNIGACFVLEEDGDIRGFVNGGVVGLVETLVADTPQAAGRLFSMMEGSLLTALPMSQHYAIVTNPAAGDLLKSQGWEKVQAEFYIKKGR